MAAGGNGGELSARLIRAWLWTALAATVATLLAIQAGIGRYLSLAFVAQDLPVIAVATGVVIATILLNRGRAGAITRLESRQAMLLLASVVAILAVLGNLLIFHAYPLSMDEFLATFDARVLRGGHLIAPVAPPYRDLVPAMMTSFALPVAGNAGWVSGYLPGNAMLLALPGARYWLPPLFGALSVALVWAIARRMTPARRDTPAIATLLLASSPQLVVTAMTTYAMTAHLALNLLWLWLILVNRRWSHGTAVVVAWLATGLHQLVFHPLFAAPFVLRMWRERQWRVATFHSLAYLAIGLFWASWPSLAFGIEGLSPPGGALISMIARVGALASRFTIADLGLMAQNMLRFIAWQNPLMIALLAIGLRRSIRSKGTEQDLLLGVVLTLLMITVLMPAQGFGWGYRYLHGLLGSIALLAAFSWNRQVGEDEERRRTGLRLTGISAGLSLLILLPLQLWQAQSIVGPRAVASERIARADVDYVLIDRGDIAYGADLVRNDPWLRDRPIILDLAELSPDRLRQLCTARSVAVFGTQEGFAAGIPPLHYVPPRLAHNRRLLGELRCDARRVP